MGRADHARTHHRATHRDVSRTLLRAADERSGAGCLLCFGQPPAPGPAQTTRAFDSAPVTRQHGTSAHSPAFGTRSRVSGHDEGAPARMLGPRREWLSGGVLLSHPVSRAVPSALRGLASGFGM